MGSQQSFEEFYKSLGKPKQSVEEWAREREMKTRAKLDRLLEQLRTMKLAELIQLKKHWEGKKSADDAREIIRLIDEVIEHYHEHAADVGDTAVLSVKQVAVFLGVSESIIRRMIKDETIPFVRIEGQYKFYRETLNDWLRDRSVTPGQTNDEDDESEKTINRIWNKTKGRE